MIASGVVGGAVGAGVGKLVRMDRVSDIKKDVETTLPPGASGSIALLDIAYRPTVDETLKKARTSTQEDVSPESAEALKEAAKTA